MPCHPPSWYRQQQPNLPKYSPLDNTIDTDICIVGGGLAGLNTAYSLSESGREVVVLEADQISAGASGRNGGMVIAGYAEDMDKVIDKVGLPTAQNLFNYSVQGAALVRQRIKSLCPSALHGEGYLAVSLFAGHELAHERDLLAQRFAHHVELLDRSDVAAMLQTDRYTHGYIDAQAFHIDPYQYALALSERFTDAGGRLFHHSRVTAIEKNGVGFRVVTSHGVVNCRDVVLTNSVDHMRSDKTNWTRLNRAILPVSTHIIVTEPLVGEHCVIKTEMAVADTRRAGNYYRVLPDGRLLWGGRIQVGDRLPTNLADLMRGDMIDIYPALATVPIYTIWSGVMGYAVHKMPIIGQLKPGLWCATAFGGHGLNTSAMAGDLIASAIVSKDQRWRDFSAYSATWAGGRIGRLAVEASYRWMQWQDFRQMR